MKIFLHVPNSLKFKDFFVGLKSFVPLNTYIMAFVGSKLKYPHIATISFSVKNGLAFTILL